MIALLTVLVALPIGWAVRDRLTAHLAYGLAFAHLYTFQTGWLVMQWAGGADDAFPSSEWSGVWGYLLVTTLVYAAGFGLVTLGRRLRTRRDARQAAVQLQPAG